MSGVFKLHYENIKPHKYLSYMDLHNFLVGLGGVSTRDSGGYTGFVTTMSPHHLRIGRFAFDPETGELRGDGTIEVLRPQTAELLDHLASRPGRLVSRKELRDRIWPKGRPDSDLGLNVCVTQLRAALGDDADDPEYIETWRGRGYRLIAPVEAIGETGAPSARRRPRTVLLTAAVGAVLVAAVWWGVERGRSVPNVPDGAQRLAVLPYRSIPELDSLQYLREGFSEDLITAFAGLDPSQLAVFGQTSTFAMAARGMTPEAVADSLGADYVLDGTIRATVDGYRVTTRLLDAETGTYVWSDLQDLTDTPTPQFDVGIVRGVLESLAISREGRELRLTPTSPATRSAVLRSRFLRDQFTRADSERAIALVEEALATDPQSVELRVELAANHLIRGEIDAAERWLQEADGLDGADAFVSHIAGRVALYGRNDPAEAVRYFERALELRPGEARLHHDLAMALVSVGRLAGAVEHGVQALELDPVSSVVQGDVGWILYYAGRNAEAREACHATLILRPESTSARSCILLAASADGALDEEVGIVDQLLAGLSVEEEARMSVVRSVEDGNERALWESLYEIVTDTDEMNAIDGARVLALLDRPTEAAAHLAEAELNPGMLRFARLDPVFERVRSEPDFARALRNAGVEPLGS